jgi:hypothetical protein
MNAAITVIPASTLGTTYAASIGLGWDPPPDPDDAELVLALAVDVVAGFELAVVGFGVEPAFALEVGLSDEAISYQPFLGIHSRIRWRKVLVLVGEDAPVGTAAIP